MASLIERTRKMAVLFFFRKDTHREKVACIEQLEQFHMLLSIFSLPPFFFVSSFLVIIIFKYYMARVFACVLFFLWFVDHLKWSIVIFIVYLLWRCELQLIDIFVHYNVHQTEDRLVRNSCRTLAFSVLTFLAAVFVQMLFIRSDPLLVQHK